MSLAKCSIYSSVISEKALLDTAIKLLQLRVKLICTEHRYYAEPIRVSGSGKVSCMTKSDGFVGIVENKEGIAEGERIAVTRYCPY
ncbi:MAG TPA: hypothetical protein VMW40_02865 [Candidatus Bathyarchaeia archaeon]|nr:hypothetical protein [Candidatus Bathyarchaeia archaeon]